MKEQDSPKIAITGAEGIIGDVLRKGLTDFDLTPIGLPGTDVRNFEELANATSGHDVIIHLAWDTKSENWKSPNVNPGNLQMVVNVYRAAKEKSVKRVIMASSVHADKYRTWEGSELMSPNQMPTPDSPYGASKVFMESLGRHNADLGLEVVCVRFGGVTPDNKPWQDQVERRAWLSHNDCVSLIRKTIEAEIIPNNFSVIYGISENEGRIHDYSNPLGWKPKESANDFFDKKLSIG